MKTLVAFLAVAAVASAQEQIPFDTVQLKVDQAETVHTFDANNDGTPDIVFMSGRRAQFFFFRKSKGFSPEPDTQIIFDADVYLWTTATFADCKGPQLVTFSSRGIRRHLRKSDREWLPAEDVLICPNLFQGAALSEASPLKADFMPDLDGDGLSDIIFFKPGELWIFPQKKDADGRPTFRIMQKLPVPTDSSLKMAYGPHEKFQQTLTVPMLIVGDMNGDKRPDIVYYREEAVGTFLQLANGRFDVNNPLALAAQKMKARNTFLKFEAPPKIADFNGDGLLDVALPYPSKGRVPVYFNNLAAAPFAAPDNVLQVEGWSTGIYIKDLDGDGKIEIMMGEVKKLGVISGVKAFIDKSVNLLVHFYRISDTGIYSKEPVQILEFSVPYTFRATRDSASVDLKFWPTFEADVNGDGLRDLLIDQDGKIGVYLGSKAKCMSEKVERMIDLNPPPDVSTTKVDVADFNGDGKSDLVIRYQIAEQKKSVVEVKLSK